MKNRFIELTSSNKKSKIVEINNNKVIAKRTFLFTTTMGNNSVGDEMLYNDFNVALIGEAEWINPEK